MNDTGGDQQRPRRWPTRTLRNGLVLVVLAALSPMAVLSIVQGRVAWDDAREIATAQLRTGAWLIAESERDVFATARQTVQVVSRARAVRAMSDDCSSVLADAHLGTVGIINLTRSDAAGRVRCSAIPFKGTESFALEPWWQQAMAFDGFSLSAPIIGKISKKPVLVVALPVRSVGGAQEGIITASISLDALRASLERRSAADPNALIEIVNADGAVILSNKKVKFSLPKNILNKGDIATTRLRDGTAWLFAAAPLQGKALTIVYAKPRDDLLASALWQVRQSILLPLIAMALASLAIWTGTHWLVVRWLRKLQVLASQFGRGDFSGNRSGYGHAPREVIALSDDLHTMAETIDARDTALTSALAAKTALTREVNHRVKNNLQIVTSLLTLQADRVADPWARDALGQAKARIAALGLIHRVLYEHDTHNVSGTVNMRLLMAELCPQLRVANRAHDTVDLTCDCEDLELSVDQAIPLTLFIVEVVTNAFRHAYAQDIAGTISIVMAKDGSQIQLAIKDDGIGYSTTDPVGKMGFELMNAFSTQLGGTLDVSSDESGTKVKLCCSLGAVLDV
jgi:two-component sensor histidine kinase